MRYQSNRPKRQFLAGVRCNACQAVDTTVQVQIFAPEFDEYIECVACGHSERRPTAQDLANVAKVGDDGVGVVKFKL